jgi:hypothetical protein
MRCGVSLACVLVASFIAACAGPQGTAQQPNDDSPLLGGSRGAGFDDAVRLDAPRSTTIRLQSATPRTAPVLMRDLARDLRAALRALPPASHGPEGESPASLSVDAFGGMRLAYAYGDYAYATDLDASFLQFSDDGTSSEVQLAWTTLYGAPLVHLRASGNLVVPAIEEALEQALDSLAASPGASGITYSR